MKVTYIIGSFKIVGSSGSFSLMFDRVNNVLMIIVGTRRYVTTKRIMITMISKGGTRKSDTTKRLIPT